MKITQSLISTLNIYILIVYENKNILVAKLENGNTREEIDV